MIKGEQTRELESGEKNVIVIMVWGTISSRQCQHYLETWWKCRFLVLDLLDQKLTVGSSALF